MRSRHQRASETRHGVPNVRSNHQAVPELYEAHGHACHVSAGECWLEYSGDDFNARPSCGVTTVPASKEISELYADEMQQWLRDPEDIPNVISAICGAYNLRFSKETQIEIPKSSWDDVVTDAPSRDTAGSNVRPRTETRRLSSSWDTM